MSLKTTLPLRGPLPLRRGRQCFQSHILSPLPRTLTSSSAAVDSGLAVRRCRFRPLRPLCFAEYVFEHHPPTSWAPPPGAWAPMFSKSYPVSAAADFVLIVRRRRFRPAVRRCRFRPLRPLCFAEYAFENHPPTSWAPPPGAWAPMFSKSYPVSAASDYDPIARRRRSRPAVRRHRFRP